MSKSIEEIRKMKAILERDIAAKVAEFEQESCVQITDVGIDRVKIKMLKIISLAGEVCRRGW